MKKYFIIALAALATFAISCNKQIEPEKSIDTNNSVSIVKSFKIVLPETKAYLGDNSETGKKLIKFNDGDEITIFANTSGNAYVGTYNSANDEFSTEITEEADAKETVFYAVYPKQVNNGSKLYNWEFSAGSISTNQNFKQNLNAVKDGFDEDVAVMTAKTDENGKLAFRYGTAFMKLGVTMDNLVKLTFNIPSGNGRFSGKPVYNADGTLNKLNNTKREITVSGSFENGGTYYVPFFTNGSKVGGPFELTFTLSDGNEKTLSTNAFSDVIFALGNIYNIGAPVVNFSPVITASNPDALEYDSTYGSVAYSISNGATLTGATVVEYTETGYDVLTLSNIEILASDVTFECSENEGENPRMCKLILSYTGSEDVEVIIKQKSKTFLSVNYTWDFNSIFSAESTLEAGTYTYPAAEDSNVMLTYTTSKSNDKVAKASDIYYLQPNGAASATDRVLSFTAPTSGTLTITGCSNKEEMRTLTVLQTSEVIATSGGSSISATPSDHVYSIESGLVKIYASQIFRYYTISFSNE